MKYLIAGLGNIGPDYENTRHNIGFQALDFLAAKHEATFESARYAFMTKFKFKARTFVLIKPTTFMNLSGKAVSYWLEKEKLDINKLLVITDDISIPLGKIRIRAKGSDGGHNGLANIVQLMGTTSFARLRFGIGDTFVKGHQVDFVLGKWSQEEKEIIQPKIKTVADAIVSFGTIGASRTMNLYNNQ